MFSSWGLEAVARFILIFLFIYIHSMYIIYIISCANMKEFIMSNGYGFLNQSDRHHTYCENIYSASFTSMQKHATNWSGTWSGTDRSQQHIISGNKCSVKSSVLFRSHSAIVSLLPYYEIGALNLVEKDWPKWYVTHQLLEMVFSMSTYNHLLTHTLVILSTTVTNTTC